MDDEIFVFGSNEAGRHGAGAALYAAKKHGAQYGVGFGPSGNSFAIPTKDFFINKLSLDSVKFYVDLFLCYAEEHPETKFRLTAIGCGLAGFKVEEIVPLFDRAPSNVLPPDPSYDKISKEFYEAFIERHLDPVIGKDYITDYENNQLFSSKSPRIKTVFHRQALF